MKRFLLDTNAASHCIHRRKGVDDKVRIARAAGHAIGIGLPVLGELFGGVEYSASRERNFAVLLRNVRTFRLWPFTAEAARAYGRIYADLRRRGLIIQQIDLQIAAIAETLGDCTIVSSDSDFRMIPHLPVEDWTD